VADTKTSALPNAAALGGTEQIPGVQSAGDVNITPTQIKTFTSASPTLVTPTISGLATITQGTANAGIIASTGYSLTGSNATPMIDLAGTWNTTGNPVGLKIAITNTASGSTSKFLSFLAGAAGATEVFSVGADGAIYVGAGVGDVVLMDANGGLGFNERNNSTTVPVVFVGRYASVARVTIASGGALGFSSSSGDVSGGNAIQDTLFTRAAAATLQQGAANAASPVAQTLQAQGSRSGTDSNVAGANYTIRSGAGTGNATPSSLILQSYVAVASGTGAQTATTCLTLTKGGGTVGVGGLIFPTADPLIAGAWWDNAGTLTKSAG
jgi:hypothetical protein